MSRQRGFALAVGVLVLGLSAAQGNASLIQPGQFLLHNHPDNYGVPPGYGLRLDELFDVTGGHDRFTFDFDHPAAEMWMDFGGASIHIYGIAFVGLSENQVEFCTSRWHTACVSRWRSAQSNTFRNPHEHF